MYAKSSTPIKEMSERALDFESEAAHRGSTEHIVRQCEIFRSAKASYRGKHRNYGKTQNVIAEIVNLGYSPATSAKSF